MNAEAQRRREDRRRERGKNASLCLPGSPRRLGASAFMSSGLPQLTSVDVGLPQLTSHRIIQNEPTTSVCTVAHPDAPRCTRLHHRRKCENEPAGRSGSRVLIPIVVLALLVCVQRAYALEPDQIALIVNDNIPESRKLAEYYAKV